MDLKIDTLLLYCVNKDARHDKKDVERRNLIKFLLADCVQSIQKDPFLYYDCLGKIIANPAEGYIHYIKVRKYSQDDFLMNFHKTPFFTDTEITASRLASAICSTCNIPKDSLKDKGKLFNFLFESFFFCLANFMVGKDDVVLYNVNPAGNIVLTSNKIYFGLDSFKVDFLENIRKNGTDFAKEATKEFLHCSYEAQLDVLRIIVDFIFTMFEADCLPNSLSVFLVSGYLPQTIYGGLKLAKAK